MPEPKAAAPNCDVPGCGKKAVHCTDGTEKDEATTLVTVPGEEDMVRRKPLDRPALPNINHCHHHRNWPHSDDARAWASGPGAEAYKARK